MPLLPIGPDRVLLRAPRWSRDLPRRADPRLGVVQLCDLPPSWELEQLDAFLERHPEIQLRLYGDYGQTLGDDLGLLRHVPHARRLAVELHELTSLDGLRHLDDGLQELVLTPTRRRVSLAVLERFRDLRRLHVHGQRRDVEAIATLPRLHDLSLQAVTLPGLDLLGSLRRLRKLSVMSGANRDLAPLAELPGLRSLAVGYLRGLTDLSALGGLERLTELTLASLPDLVTPPDLTACSRLEQIHVAVMKRMTDLRWLRTAPALRRLSLAEMPQLRWEHVQVLEGLALEELQLGTGSIRRDADLRARLGFPAPH